MDNRLRRTMMYVPGNSPAMIQNAHIYGSDSLMFDLEDSVSPLEKDSARQLVFEAVQTIDYGDKELVVRINGLDVPTWRMDVRAMVQAGIDVIRLPKTESAADLQTLEAEIEAAEQEFGIEIGKTKMMAAIETAEGVLNAREIAKASKRMIGIAIGAEDYVVDLKTKRSPSGIELTVGRGLVLLAARSAGIAALDTAYTRVGDMEGFIEEVKLIKQLGFDGKSVINPNQIDPLHKIYAPTDHEISEALDIMDALEEAKAKGSGVINLRGKMIDKPIVDRAERVIELAKAMGVMLNNNDSEGDEENA